MNFFPDGFPTQSQARVEAEKILAYRKLVEAKEKVSRRSEREALIRNCILRIFLSFVEGACALGRENVWTVVQIDAKANEFLRRLTIATCAEQGDDSIHRNWISNWNGSLTQDVERQFKESPQWKKYEDLQLAVAKAQAKEPHKQALEVLASTSMRNPKQVKLGATKTGKKDNPEVAKRRLLARSDLSVPAQELCETFDREKVPLPLRWKDAGQQSWKTAYNTKGAKYRSRISVLISKDRRTV